MLMRNIKTLLMNIVMFEKKVAVLIRNIAMLMRNIKTLLMNVAMFARTAFIFRMMNNKIAIANLSRLASDRTTNNPTSHLAPV